MRRRLSRRSVVCLGFTVVTMLAVRVLSAHALDPAVTVHAVGAHATIEGRVVALEFMIGLKAGVDPAPAATGLVAGLRARGVIADDFRLAGHLFGQFFDRKRQNDAVTMFYNPDGDPTGGGRAALRAALDTWNDVRRTSFRFAFGGTSHRCPSLSFDCPAPSAPDGFNDVGWRPIPLNDPEFVIFGYVVTDVDVFTGEATEADIVLNTDVTPFAWFTDGAQHVDVQSVILHELGHVAGLDHAFTLEAVMGPALLEVRRTLASTDVDGLRFVYPERPPVLTDHRSAQDFQLLAERDMPAPGGGAFLNRFEVGGSTDTATSCS